MLTSLRIENFAIVSLLELDFKSGLTVFTGETGAGKSIMIDALMLVLGGRADHSVVRANTKQCDVSAVFAMAADSEPTQWLQQHDLGFDATEVVLRRVVSAEGRSKCYINAQPVPLQKLKELSDFLVHIHGQHQQHTLLHHTTHRVQLDRYANHDDLVKGVESLHHECQKIRLQMDDLKQQDAHEERMQWLTFQCDELAQLNLSEGESLLLHQEHQSLHHAHEYLETAQELLNMLSEDEDFNVQHRLNLALQRVSLLPEHEKEVQSMLELLHQASIQVDEVIDGVKQFLNRVQVNPKRLFEVEARMSVLHQMARKHHVSVQDLPSHALKREQELLNLKSSAKHLEQLQLQYETKYKAYQRAAQELSESRRKHAVNMAQAITKAIQSLGMPQGFFEVFITPLDKGQAHGMDKVEYFVCTNPGMSPDVLGKIASGGELSRISLAIHMVSAARALTPTLLFDEVDVGIGGATAALVGQMLRKLGEQLQVFCVTHQPQVAASAHEHFRVEKQTKDGQTYTSVCGLTVANQIDELARMLGGLTVNEQTRQNALVLLEESRAEL